MKNKKWIQKLILLLVILVATMLCTIIIFGNLKTKQVADYKRIVQETACKFVVEKKYSKSLCDAFEGLCNISLSTLTTEGYLDSNLQNPLTKEYVKDTKEYVEVTWNNGDMVCTYKEG